MRKLFLFILFITVLNCPVHSYDSKDLKSVEQQISTHKKKSSELEKKAKDNEKALKEIQAKSIKISKSIQSNSNQISNIKTELIDLSASLKIKEMQLDTNEENSKAVLSSLIRISSIPTDGLVIASDSPQELINTRILLNSALPHLKEQAQKLQEGIVDIEKAKQSISDKKEKLINLNSTTTKERKEIAALLKKKQALKSQLTSEQKKEKTELAKLAKQASSMKDFIKRLQSRKLKAKPRTKPSQNKSKSKPKSEIKFTGTKGRYPIAGRISLGYGKKNPQDMTNYGWEMKGRANGLVTCPIAGEVLYSGEFGSYDQMLVFDNGNGYNIVLAGMGKVGVEVGDKLKAGEPVGFLKSSPAELYVEVRKNGNPINPTKVIK